MAKLKKISWAGTVFFSLVTFIWLVSQNNLGVPESQLSASLTNSDSIGSGILVVNMNSGFDDNTFEVYNGDSLILTKPASSEEAGIKSFVVLREKYKAAAGLRFVSGSKSYFIQRLDFYYFMLDVSLFHEEILLKYRSTGSVTVEMHK